MYPKPEGKLRNTDSSRDIVWELYGIMPAMALPTPIEMGSVVFCATQDSSRFIGPEDAQYPLAAILASNFTTFKGEHIATVGLMLIRRDKRSTLAPLGIPRMCRDALALSCITRGTMRHIQTGNQLSVSASDYFDLVPLRLKNGKAVIVDSPALLGYHPRVELRNLRLVHPIHLRASSLCEFEHDEHLLRALTKAVEHFIRGRRRPALRQVFRSLTMSYHACRALTESESTYYDLGTRVVEWISAFEILCHPERGEVKKKDVLDLIDAVPWARLWRLPSERRADILRRLTDRRHKCSDGKNPKRRNAACHFYDQLYRLRNDLAHGNQVKQRKFFARSQPGRWRVDRATPLLFRLCLMEKFRQIGVLPQRSSGPVTRSWIQGEALHREIRERLDEDSYQEAFAKSLFAEAPP